MKQFIYLSIAFLFLGCNNNPETTITPTNTSTVNQEPTLLSYTVVNQFPHLTTSFTEGLEWHNNALYESTGLANESKLLKADLITGKEIQKIDLPKTSFGEGLTLFKGKIYQLTYQEGKCFVYDALTFKKLKEFTYDGEGWGMTNDGKYLIHNNGGSNLYFRDPETFKIIKVVGVTDNKGVVENINELEYINGFIYANIWMTNTIIKIDTNTGKVVAKANLDGLQETYFPAQANKDNVLNGIAYDSTNKRLFITGKNWPKVLEIKGLVD